MLTSEPLKNAVEQKVYGTGINIAACRHCLQDQRNGYYNTVKVPVTPEKLAHIKTWGHLTKAVPCCGLGSPTGTIHQVTVTLTA